MGENKMNKPFSMIYEDFKQELANLINNSGLPAFVIESILQNYLYETKDVAKRQYLYDKSQYEKILSKDNLSEEKDIKQINLDDNDKVID